MSSKNTSISQTFDGVRAVLLDIEGTICPITFVKDTLFPYALEALPKVLVEKWDSEDFKVYRDAFPEEAKESPESFEAHVKDLTKRDVKIAYLKNLQGFLWQEGYESKAYSTPLYEDVVPQLKKWHDQSASSSNQISINIYSSGSVFAQKLLFAHVQDATQKEDPKATIDLSYLISDWFDTTNAGPKTEKSSYIKIADKLGKPAASILFLSDNVKEIEAALDAGMKAVVVDRPGNAVISADDKETFDIVTSFDQLVLPQPDVASIEEDTTEVGEKRKLMHEDDDGGATNSDRSGELNGDHKIDGEPKAPGSSRKHRKIDSESQPSEAKD